MNDPQRQYTRRIGKWMIFLAWAVGLGLLTLYFQNFLNQERNPNQQVNSRVSDSGEVDIVLQRNRYGHYVTSGEVNGQRVEFFLDTGASDVAIPRAVADKLGLKRGAARQYNTANGRVTAYRTVLDSVAIGPFEITNVPASINPGLLGKQILLGMSFLKHVEFSQRGDKLVLHVRP